MNLPVKARNRMKLEICIFYCPIMNIKQKITFVFFFSLCPTSFPAQCERFSDHLFWSEGCWTADHSNLECPAGHQVGQINSWKKEENSYSYQGQGHSHSKSNKEDSKSNSEFDLGLRVSLPPTQSLRKSFSEGKKKCFYYHIWSPKPWTSSYPW